MHDIPHHLLQPSLGARTSALRAPYSTTVGMMAAFLGGPFAALGLVGVNAWRLGRLKRDAIVLAALLAAYLLLDFWLMQPDGPLAALAGSLSTSPRDTYRLASRAISIVFFAIGLGLHRQAQRTTDLMGLKRPNGWIMGIGMIAGGIAVQAAWAIAITGAGT